MDVDKLKISVITCTYNPDVQIFKKLIAAIALMQWPSKSTLEWIIVDNNSSHAIKNNFDFSNVKMEVVHVSEINPGLTHARIAGSKMAKGDWLVFFDDDNEPNDDYLVNAAVLIKTYKNVKCWGAGNIFVNFQETKDSNWLQNYKNVYQERHIYGEIIQKDKAWNSNYPQGTGQIITKILFNDYLEQVANGIYSLSDRKGQSLSSGGDVQIALNVIKNGYKVGISEKLSLQHNIDANKSTFEYLFKLIYGMASGAILSHNQVFKTSKKDFHLSNSNVLKVLINYIRQFKLNVLKRKNLTVFAQRMGNLNAQFVANENIKNKPLTLRLIEKYCF